MKSTNKTKTIVELFSNMDNLKKLNIAVKVVAIICMLSITATIVYYFIVYLPYKEEARVQKINNCLVDAQEAYIKQWDQECEAIEQEPECPLKTDRRATIVKQREEAKDECYKLY